MDFATMQKAQKSVYNWEPSVQINCCDFSALSSISLWVIIYHFSQPDDRYD